MHSTTNGRKTKKKKNFAYIQLTTNGINVLNTGHGFLQIEEHFNIYEKSLTLLE